MPLMTPEQMYRIGMGLGTAQMQGEQQGISLYGHMMQTQKLQEELNKTGALRELARSIPQSQTYTLSGQTMPQGMTGNEEYVPAETQTQKVEVPYSMSERLSMYGAKAMQIDPMMGTKFIAAATELQKATDPMEKAARFGKFFNEIRTLPVKAKQALLGSMAQTPEWKKLFGNADISNAMNTDEGTVVPARDDEGNIIGHHVLSPDGSKWDFRKTDSEKGGIGQYKDFQKMTPEEQKGYIGFQQAINPKHFTYAPTKTDLTEKQKLDTQTTLRKEFNARPEIKEYNQVQPKFASLEKTLIESQTTGNKVASDQAMITLFNKITDPTSVVRESEYARTPANLALINRLKGKVEKVMTGGAGLTDQDRQAIISMVRQFKAGYQELFNRTAQEYSDYAKGYGIDPTMVIGERRTTGGGTRGNTIKYDAQGNRVQ